MRRSRCAGCGRNAVGRQAARARDHVSDVGVVPVPRRRLHRGRDQGDRVAGPVGLLERGLDGADHLGDHPGPQTAGPPRVPGVVRTHAAARSPGRPVRPPRWRRWAPRGGRSCAGGGCWGSTGSTSTCPTARRTPPSSATPARGDNRSAFPKARVVALAECGTHAFVAAEVDAYCVGEKTLAQRLLPRLRADELLTADRGLLLLAGLGHRHRDRGGAAVAGPDPARAARRAGAAPTGPTSPR